MSYFKRLFDKPVKIPELNPKDFGMHGYDCVFIKAQPDNTIVGLYRSQDINNYHWLVVRGHESVVCNSLKDARVYCQRMNYDI